MKRFAGVMSGTFFLVGILTLAVWADGDKTIGVYKRGQIQLRVAGKSYTVPALTRGWLTEGGSIELSYAMEGEIPAGGGEPTRVEVRLAMSKVRAPGKYGNANVAAVRVNVREGFALKDIQGFLDDPARLQAFVQARTKTAVFDRQRSTCNVDLTRLAPSGIQGNMTCTNMTDGRGGAGAPLTGVTFQAAP